MDTMEYLLANSQIFILIFAVMVFAFIWNSRKAKESKAIMAETDGKHSAEFKIGSEKGFIAEDVLYFSHGISKALNKVELKEAVSASAYRTNGVCYVKFYNEKNKQVGKTAGTLQFSKSSYVQEFYDFIRQNAAWIEIN